MRIQDAGYPEAKETAWGREYGMRRFPERLRPFIDDAPPRERGTEVLSRWGARPAKTLDRPIDGVFKSLWTRVRSALHGGR